MNLENFAALKPYFSFVSLNVVLLGLFGWQALTGIQIVQDILSKMGTSTTTS